MKTSLRAVADAYYQERLTAHAVAESRSTHGESLFRQLLKSPGQLFAPLTIVLNSKP